MLIGVWLSSKRAPQVKYGKARAVQYFEELKGNQTINYINFLSLVSVITSVSCYILPSVPWYKNLRFELGLASIYLGLLYFTGNYLCFVKKNITINLVNYMTHMGKSFFSFLLQYSSCKGRLREKKKLRNKKNSNLMGISFPLVQLGSGNVSYIYVRVCVDVIWCYFASTILIWCQFFGLLWFFMLIWIVNALLLTSPQA